MINDTFFYSGKLKIFARICLPKEYKVGVVFLHGGGSSSSLRYKFLQKEFEKNGIASLSFDFVGCGKSEGNFEDGSLDNRRLTARHAVEFFINKSGLNISQIYIWGSSMGAHIACRLTKELNFKGVILQSAAAYSREAEKAKLNQEFTNLITTEDNWANSPAFADFEYFKNKKLVIYGKNDKVIPEGVKEKYKSLLSSNDRFVEVNLGSHSLLNPQNESENKALREVSSEGIKFIN